MLVKLEQLILENSGYERNISRKDIYVNLSNIISIADYSNINSFLKSEGSVFLEKNFSLIKVNQGNTHQEIIVFGTAEELYLKMNKDKITKKILND